MDRRSLLGRTSLALAALAAAPVSTAAAAAAGKARSAAADDRPLGLRYLETIRGMLESIRAREADNLLEAAHRVAETVKRGNICYTQWDMGHNIEFDIFPDRPDDPRLFVNGWKEENAREGDFLLLSFIGKPITDPHDKGVFVIGAPSPWCAESPNPELLTEQNRALKYRHFCDIWIDTGISTWGPVMWIPGSPVPMGPASGPLGMMTFWMIVSDAVRILAEDSVAVNVGGDESPLAANAVRVSTGAPLGRMYYEEAMRQLKGIEGEFGTVDAIAELVVDAVLNGRHVYYYSTYPNSLAYESVYRRGGLLLNRSVMAGKDGPVGGPHFGTFDGGKGDIVVMGVWRPDDPVNLRDQEAFLKMGMRVVAIGPATRDGGVPKGETVPGRAEMHLGCMCDTYGLFALPGLDRKVCPTSGLLINQMYYAVQMQVAEKIIARTGNVPRIDANAAMIGGLDKRRRDLEIIRVRGY